MPRWNGGRAAAQSPEELAAAALEQHFGVDAPAGSKVAQNGKSGIALP